MTDAAKTGFGFHLGLQPFTAMAHNLEEIMHARVEHGTKQKNTANGRAKGSVLAANHGHNFTSPLVVAVIPAYNEERFIGSAVLSARKYSNAVIVVDDGSADATAEVAATAGTLVVQLAKMLGRTVVIRTDLSQAWEFESGIVFITDEHQTLQNFLLDLRVVLRCTPDDPHCILRNEDENGEQSRNSPPKSWVSIILPAYNEAVALPKVLKDIRQHSDERFEVLVVDDGSVDQTAQIARDWRCNVVSHETNSGKGAAIKTGITHSSSEFLIIMDADATYPASAIGDVVKLLEDHDIVRCVRRYSEEEMPFTNRVGNFIFGVLLEKLMGLDGNDHLSGLYGLRRDAIEKLDLASNGFDIEAEISFKAKLHGLTTANIPINYGKRLGEKKLDAWRDGWIILRRIIFMILVHNPTLTFVSPGMLIMLVSLGAALFLWHSPLITPYFGLSIHSFILGMIGLLAGFQFMIFGVAATLYGVEAGYQPNRWLVSISSTRFRLGVAFAGLMMSIAALIGFLSLIFGWIQGGAALFGQTESLVFTAAAFVWGLQILSASLFVSIFSGRVSEVAKLA